MVADLDRVHVRLEGRLAADHAGVAATLRRQAREPRAVAAQGELARDLAEDDRAFGLDGQVAWWPPRPAHRVAQRRALLRGGGGVGADPQRDRVAARCGLGQRIGWAAGSRAHRLGADRS